MACVPDRAGPRRCCESPRGALPHAGAARAILPAPRSAHLVRRTPPVALPWRRVAIVAAAAEGLARLQPPGRRPAGAAGGGAMNMRGVSTLRLPPNERAPWQD